MSAPAHASPRCPALVEAVSRIDALLGIAADPRGRLTVSTGIPAIDSALPGNGLRRGGVHEWIGTCDPAPTRTTDRRWSPAFTLLITIAHSVAAERQGAGRRLVWVGEQIWPYAPSLARGPSGCRVMLDHSLFVRSMTAADRLWTADMALRSRAPGAVIVDGSTFDLAATRRLQLAAEAGGVLCLLARPPWEQGVLSAATSRWRVSRAISPSVTGRWSVELLRCKGMQPAAHGDRSWVLERDDATGALRVAADVLHGSRTPETTPVRIRDAG